MPWLQLRNNVRKKARNSQLERSASMVELQLMSVEETSFYRIRRSCLRHCIKITWLMYVEHESWSGFKGHSLPTSFTSSFVLYKCVFYHEQKSCSQGKKTYTLVLLHVWELHSNWTWRGGNLLEDNLLCRGFRVEPVLNKHCVYENLWQKAQDCWAKVTWKYLLASANSLTVFALKIHCMDANELL